MGLQICSLSSGSTGNCIYVASRETRLLIDAGIPGDRTARSLAVLGAKPSDGLNVLITHGHNDHVSGLSAFGAKSGAKVFAHRLTAHRLAGRSRLDLTEFDEKEFCIGDISVTPFTVPHDVPCVGFTLRHGRAAVSVLTDLGEAEERVIQCLLDSDVVLIESNHDESLVKCGAYPWPLKKRILSREGHLSNAASAAVCARVAAAGRCRQLILGHLSRENNSPELAFNTALSALNSVGCVEGKDIALEVAPAVSMSGLYEIC
jgi:phosphoribosyl 1,2-cyclic phosphodiesterase